MTYRELFYKATRLINNDQITLGEYEEMTKPLDREVEQEPKTGHWILGICDNCGYDWGKDAPIASVPNYCPNCGCRMVEPQESEDKE